MNSEDGTAGPASAPAPSAPSVPPAPSAPSAPPAAGRDVDVGDELPRRVIESVSAEKMKTMAALLGDPNTVHWDVEDVRRLGLGDRPVNQGPNNMGYVIDMLTDWAGGPANFRRLKVRFLGNVLAEDRLIAGGKVTAVRSSAEGRLVDCDVWLARDGTEAVLAGSATVLLPD